ncbi:MAG: helix-turn-helix domain-containing protein [Spirochaetaceae bacterium]|nr:helix-turn-helix domain-containing protein [bacterium]MBP3450435.1 helix-turn-helix domain-containing protein [Spirochaetaceae bacterium]
MNNQEIINRLLEFFNLKLAQIEKEIEISNGYLKKFEKGEIEKPKLLIDRLQRKGLNPEYFLSGEGVPKIEQPSIPANVQERIIPFLENLLTADEKDKLLSIPGSQDFPDLKALRVSGDSMAPTVKDGDVVVCGVDGWQGDGLYVYLAQNFPCVKRLILLPDGYQIMNDNKIYPTWTCKTDEIEIVGRVYYTLIRV